MPAEKNASLQEKSFSEYPNSMDAYFQKNNVTIKILPVGIMPEIEKKYSDFVVSSAAVYLDYLNAQIAFWEMHDPENKMSLFSNFAKLKSAKAHFENAHKYYKTGSNSSGDSSLKSSITEIASGSLFSKTVLAKSLIKYQNESADFFSGFKGGLSENKKSNIQQTVGFLEGFNAALAFRKYSKDVCKATKGEMTDFEEAVATATQKFSDLNGKYVESFHAQEQRIEEFEKFTSEEIKKVHEDSTALFNNIETRRQELEDLYEEKLKLKAPAEYWNSTSQKYKNNGRLWLIASAVLAIIIVIMLITIIVHSPNIVSEESHWFDVFKNSAIITVITSVAVYMLRLLVKMALSSFHLARDASEREQLTYVYLALIEGKAITDKERAIILNALFSRADTGLLKGDSAPTMSTNVTGLVETLTKK